MTRTAQYPAHANRRHPPPALSVMHAFETAVLLMEQSGATEEDIMKYVHLVHMGWIRDGKFAPEYLELVRQVEIERQQQEMTQRVTQQRIEALRDTINSTVITSVSA